MPRQKGQATLETLVASGAAIVAIVGGIGWPVYWMGRMEARMDATDKRIEAAVTTLKEKTDAINSQVNVVQSLLIEKGINNNGK